MKENKAKQIAKMIGDCAVTVDQLNIYGLRDIDLKTCITQGVAPMVKVGGEWVETNKTVIDELIDLQSRMSPLVDEGIREDAVQFASDDENLLDYALGCLSYDEKDVSSIEGEEEYLDSISKAHSVQHKQHKQHKRKEYPQDWKDAAKVMGQKDWCSKYTNQPKLYQRLKKEV